MQASKGRVYICARRSARPPLFSTCDLANAVDQTAYPPHYVRIYERPVIAPVVVAPAPIVVESAPVVVAPVPVVVAPVVETIVRPVYPIYHHYWHR
jgi:hypothetical protein